VKSGPEVEFWIDLAGEALYKRNDWGLLPFMALSDGAHTMTEEFSYFTLLEKEPPTTMSPGTGFGTSLFGISCTRQIRADKLKRRSIDVTRSTVQKAVVVVSPTARGMVLVLMRAVGIERTGWGCYCSLVCAGVSPLPPSLYCSSRHASSQQSRDRDFSDISILQVGKV